MRPQPHPIFDTLHLLITLQGLFILILIVKDAYGNCQLLITFKEITVWCRFLESPDLQLGFVSWYMVCIIAVAKQNLLLDKTFFMILLSEEQPLQDKTKRYCKVFATQRH